MICIVVNTYSLLDKFVIFENRYFLYYESHYFLILYIFYVYNIQIIIYRK